MKGAHWTHRVLVRGKDKKSNQIAFIYQLYVEEGSPYFTRYITARTAGLTKKGASKKSITRTATGFPVLYSVKDSGTYEYFGIYDPENIEEYY